MTEMERKKNNPEKLFNLERKTNTKDCQTAPHTEAHTSVQRGPTLRELPPCTACEFPLGDGRVLFR